jgi:hypothetical protein
MNTEFSGREFDALDVEGYQLRVPRNQIVIRPPWSPERLLLNPYSRYPLSSSGFLWPSALSMECDRELEDPVTGLILAIHYPVPLLLLMSTRASCYFSGS